MSPKTFSVTTGPIEKISIHADKIDNNEVCRVRVEITNVSGAVLCVEGFVADDTVAVEVSGDLNLEKEGRE